MPLRRLLGLVCLWLFTAALTLAQTTREKSLEVVATTQASPAQITLQWPAWTNTGLGAVTELTVYRRPLGSTANWNANTVSVTPLTATSYVDNNVVVGTPYEYLISRTIGANPSTQAYVSAGINLPLVESRGRIVMVVENNLSLDYTLKTALDQYQQDLVADGWTVSRIEVPRMAVEPDDDSANSGANRLAELVNVKNQIKAIYDADPANTKAVVLIGHVPVPYSGNSNPDEHPDHLGAWPTDAYYGDMTTAWTDTINHTTSVNGRQKNIIGDGKFDYTVGSSPAGFVSTLAVGRIDMKDLLVFANTTENQLLTRYLQRLHSFKTRSGAFATIQRRALVDENTLQNNFFSGGAYARSTYQNSAALFGAGSTYELDWFTTLNTNPYLLASGSGSGTDTSSQGVGTTTDFATTTSKAVVNGLMGSYFGDWDKANNFLRASLAGTADSHGLVSMWSLTAWLMHDLAIGRTIGDSYIKTANNIGNGAVTTNTYRAYVSDPYFNFANSVQINLMGDPALRLFVPQPVQALSAATSSTDNNVTLTWTLPATETAIAGCRVYRSTSASGPFVQVGTQTGPAATSFADTVPSAGAYHYQVRLIKNETTGTATFANASLGVTVLARPGQSIPVISITGDAAFGNLDETSGSLARTFRITNTGSGTLNLSAASITGINPADFTLSGLTTPLALTAGQFQDFTITFNPTVNGARSAVLSVTNDSISTAATYSLTGTGTYVTGADLLGAESFNYASGSALSGKVAPAPFGTWSGTGTVNATGLTYGALNTGNLAGAFTGNTAIVPAGATYNAGVRYVSFLASNLGTSGLYACLEFMAGTNSSTDKRFSVGVSNDGRSGGGFMIERNRGIGGIYSKSSVARDNATHLFVVKIDYSGGVNNHLITWWIDPVLAAGEPAVTNPMLIGNFEFSHLRISTNGTTATVFDELRVGKTFASVTPSQTAAPTVLSGQTASGTVNAAFSYTISAQPTPSSYALASGTLPPGVALNTTTGLLSGTPTTAGTYSPYFTATNDNGTSPAAVVTLTIAPPSVISTRTGTYLGTTGSYSGTTTDSGDKAFDGNTATFFDATNASGNWVGLDLGTAYNIAELRYYPRASHPSRMNGGVFEGSSTADFSSGVVTLYTISTTPSVAWTTVTTVASGPFRYVRYVAPSGSYGNVAEIEFRGSLPGGSSAPVITASQSASGTLGAAFSYQIAASNTPTSYALSSGTLPAGVTLNTNTGLLSGAPTASGTFTPYFTATNANGPSPAVPVTLNIAAGVTVLSGTTAYDGVSYTTSFDSMGTTGTTPPTGWSAWTGTPGSSAFTWSSSTGILGGASSTANSVGTLVATSSGLTASSAPTTSNVNSYNAGAPGNSADRLLASAPTSINGVAFQLALTNTSLSSITALTLGYDIRRFTTTTSTDELPGYQLFQSTDGGTTWTNVTALNPAATGTAPTVVVANSTGVTTVSSVVVNLTSAWASGASLMLRWVDDNSQVSSPDQIIGLDNVSITPAATITPTLLGVWSGNVSPNSATVVAMLNTYGISTRLAVSTASDLSNPAYFGPVSTDAATGNAARLNATGLSANTTYYYAVELDGSLQTGATQTGKFKTFPAAGPASFRFVMSACGDEPTRSTYDAIRNLESDALFFLHMGDLNYANTNNTDPEAYRVNYRTALALVTTQGALFRSMPMTYMWDDHDFSGDNSNKTSLGRTAHQQAYREMVPSYTLAAGSGSLPIYQTYTVGRVRFIITDLRSDKDPQSATDDATKSMMGATQKQWFKDQLLAARDSGAPLIIWNSSVPFISTETIASGSDNWGVYQTERLELLTFIRDNNIKNLMIVSGDMHALAYDSGAATEAYLPGVRIPVFHAAALTRTGSVKGGPYDGGTSQGLDKYGTIDITDNGGLIDVTYTGKTTTSATTATVWKTYTFTTEAVAAPADPSALAATAASTSQINLTWTDNASTETGFKLERSPNGTTGWTQIATPAANATSYSDTGLSAATAYYYRLRATNAAGDSAYTATASASTQTGVQAFRATYGLAANGSQDLLTPAGDGIANLLKYAFNLLGNGTGQAPTLATPNASVLDPAGSAGLPYVSLLSAPSSSLQITYLRRKASTAPGITYAIEFTNDLGIADPWAVNPAATESATSLDSTFERVTVTDSVATPSKRFARVKVTAL